MQYTEDVKQDEDIAELKLKVQTLADSLFMVIKGCGVMADDLEEIKTGMDSFSQAGIVMSQAGIMLTEKVEKLESDMDNSFSTVILGIEMSDNKIQELENRLNAEGWGSK